MGSMHDGLQLGPPERWWDDGHFVRQLHLSTVQQRKLDSIFEQDRPLLVQALDNLVQEQQRMQALTSADSPDENAILAEIDRVSLARAALEKANTRLMFRIRAELTKDQIRRLQRHP